MGSRVIPRRPCVGTDNKAQTTQVTTQKWKELPAQKLVLTIMRLTGPAVSEGFSR